MSSIGHSAYRINAIETASPEQLTLMCYDGALRFMRRASKAIDDNDMAEASNSTGRAQAIINELNITLNMEAGGDIAKNLREIYLFVNRHLSQALLDKSSASVQESINLILDIRDAWAVSMNLEKGSAAA